MSQSRRFFLCGRLRLCSLAALVLCLFGLTVPSQAKLITIEERGGLAGAYFFPDRTPDLIGVFLFIKSGGFYGDGPDGLAHYLEHLVWLSAVNPDGLATTARDDGAKVDGWLTTYFLKGKPEELSTYLETLAKVFEPPSLDETFMREEVEIIKREYDYRIVEDSLYPVSRDIETRLFGDEGRGRSTIGTPESIAALTPDLAMELHARTHVPANAVLFIMGNADRKTVLPLVEKHFGNIASGNAPEPYQTSPLQEGREIVETRVEGLTSDRLVYTKRIKLEAPIAQDLLRRRLSLLYAIWDSTLEGSLAKPLRFDDFIASEFSVGFDVLAPDEVLMIFNAVPDEGVDLSKLLTAFEETIEAIAEDGIPEATFERIKKKRLDFLDHSKGRRWLALDLVRHQTIDHAEPIDSKTYIERLGETTRDEMNDLVRALASPGQVAAALVSPEASE